jgi:hypothetical protein
MPAKAPRTLTRNVLPDIYLYPRREGTWLEDLRDQRTIRPVKVRKALRTPTPRKKKKKILSKAEKDALTMLTPEMRAMLGL